jgi:hypothetical protein
MKHLPLKIYLCIFLQSQMVFAVLSKQTIPQIKSPCLPASDLMDYEGSGCHTPSTRPSTLKNDTIWNEKQREIHAKLKILQKKETEMQSHLDVLIKKFHEKSSYQSVLKTLLLTSSKILCKKLIWKLLQCDYRGAIESVKKYLEKPHYDEEIYGTYEFQKLYPQPLFPISNKKELLTESFKFVKNVSLDAFATFVAYMIACTLDDDKSSDVPFIYPDFSPIRHFFLNRNSRTLVAEINYSDQKILSFFKNTGENLSNFCMNSFYYTGLFLDVFANLLNKKRNYFSGKGHKFLCFSDRRAPQDLLPFRLESPIEMDNLMLGNFWEDGALSTVGACMRKIPEITCQSLGYITHHFLEKTILTIQTAFLITEVYSRFVLAESLIGFTKLFLSTKNFFKTAKTRWENRPPYPTYNSNNFYTTTNPDLSLPLPPALIEAQKELETLKKTKASLEEDLGSNAQVSSLSFCALITEKLEKEKNHLETIDEASSIPEENLF